MSHHRIPHHETQESSQAKALQSGPPLPSASTTLVERDSNSIVEPELVAIESELSHAAPKTEAKTKANTPAICRYCGILTSRVKAHERQCGLRKYNPSG